METVVRIECSKCKVAVLMKVRAVKPDVKEASIRITATNILMPCGHHASDEKRWTGDVAEMEFEIEKK